ncbi:ankyrin-3-like [Ostrinia nubilalis]|uniref:ankyrin-3-like n=1 Tax=Ostrinia furnacalis TaxID=93504 RepID=UPI0010403B13|nr:ankyrin-3-like [Ostrinia furnacalis]
MDFSSHNPNSTNALSLAARRNDPKSVQRLLKKINPNAIDNRGWTSLHEAADSDSYECVVLILNDHRCRPLAETHEGHTALYLACRRRCSVKTIKALLDAVEDIANYGSCENVTPLHVVSAQGRVEVIQLLIEYGAIIDVEDFDGDTPLHDAALANQHESVELLLHAGADANISNDNLLTPFHLACSKGGYRSVQNLFPFVYNINQLATGDESPLMLAIRGGSEDVVKFLLDNDADHIVKNQNGHTALDIAMTLGYNKIFEEILYVTDPEDMNPNIILCACKPHLFKLEVLRELLNYDFGPEFFDYTEPFYALMEKIGGTRPEYLINAPLNSYLNICEYIYRHSPEMFREFFYLFLMRGVAVNANNVAECPPLVYLHFSMHNLCFKEVFNILREHGCNVDYCSSSTCTDMNKCLPDAFIASLTADPQTMPIMMQYSLRLEPRSLISFIYDNGMANRLSLVVLQKLISMIDYGCEDVVTAATFRYEVPSLRHLARLQVRYVLRNRSPRITSTKEYLEILKCLPIPPLLIKYLQYM